MCFISIAVWNALYDDKKHTVLFTKSTVLFSKCTICFSKIDTVLFKNSVKLFNVACLRQEPARACPGRWRRKTDHHRSRCPTDDPELRTHATTRPPHAAGFWPPPGSPAIHGATPCWTPTFRRPASPSLQRSSARTQCGRRPTKRSPFSLIFGSTVLVSPGST